MSYSRENIAEMNCRKKTPFIVHKQKSSVSEICQKSSKKLITNHWKPKLNKLPTGLFKSKWSLSYRESTELLTFREIVAYISIIPAKNEKFHNCFPAFSPHAVCPLLLTIFSNSTDHCPEHILSLNLAGFCEEP